MAPTHPIQDVLEAALTEAAARLRGAGFPDRLVDSFGRLAGQVREPFLLAIVGQVSAGKSTLVNALLGCDLPTVGATETTATVNWFRPGGAADAGTVYCYRNGSATPEPRPVADLRQLQGDSEAALRAVAEIDRLEFRLPSAWLRSLTLVDTPGLNAVAAEHQNRTASFIGLASQLRQRGADETIRFSREADALLYVLRPTPSAADRKLIEDFHRSARGDGAAFTSVAVLGKMDWFVPDVSDWPRHARAVTDGLGRVVCRVAAVSAGMHRVVQAVRGSEAATRAFERLVREPDDDVFDDCLVWDADFPAAPVAEIVPLLEPHLWSAFQVVARYGRGRRAAPVPELFAELDAVSGVASLRHLIDRTLADRGALLRCRRIARDAERLLLDPTEAAAEHVARGVQEDAAERVETDRFLDFLRRAGRGGAAHDRQTAADLGRFVAHARGGAGRGDRAKATAADAAAVFVRIRRDLDGSINDLESLQLVADLRSELSPAHAAEFVRLFTDRGAGPLDRLPAPAASAFEREQFWRAAVHADDRIQALFDRAAERYSTLLYQLRGIRP